MTHNLTLLTPRGGDKMSVSEYLNGDGRTLVENGLDIDFKLTEAMADFYILERLSADGSKVARKMLAHHETRLARSFAGYMLAIVGAELRHTGRHGVENEDCECPCECGSCFELDEYDPGCVEACYDEDGDRVCEPEPGDGIHNFYTDCCCARCCGCCPRSHSGDMSDYPLIVSDEVGRFLADWSDHSGERMDAGTDYLRVAGEIGEARACRDAAEVYSELPWDGNYGGRSWALIATLAADYFEGMVKARTFVDRCWTIQHNGGAVFDKAWGYGETKNLQRMLEKQAEEDYHYLSNRASSDVKRLWRVRDYFLLNLSDRSEEWRGVQRPEVHGVEW